MNGLTVEENLWLSARRVARPRADAGGGRRGDRSRCRSSAIARRLVGELAHGQRQLVEIGLVLAQRPWLVLLDEPAAGITGAEADQLVRIIHEVNQKATVVVVDHDMQFVRMLGGTRHGVAPGRDPARRAGRRGARRRRRCARSTSGAAPDERDDATHGRRRRRTRPTTRARERRRPRRRRPARRLRPRAGAARHRRSQLQRGRGGRHRRPQRHRQDDVAEDADRPGAGDRRPHLDRRHRRHADEGARRAAGSASATCRRGAASCRA